jgi:hypothetical protein
MPYTEASFKAKPRSSKLVAIAYACFLGVGLFWLLTLLLDLIVFLAPSWSEEYGELFALLVFFPLFLLTFPAQGLGIVLSFLDWPLLILSGISLLVWARGSLWPEFCQNVWRAGTCTNTATGLSGIVFVAFGLQYFLFKKFLLHHRRLLLIGLGASAAWGILVLLLKWNTVTNAVNTLWSTDAADCVTISSFAITPECGDRVRTASGTLTQILASVAAFPVGLLTLGTVASLGNRQRKSNQGTEA